LAQVYIGLGLPAVVGRPTINPLSIGYNKQGAILFFTDFRREFSFMFTPSHLGLPILHYIYSALALR